MKPITAPLLSTLYGTPLATCAPYVDPMIAACAKHGINTLFRTAAFLGQLGVESQGLRKMVEDLNYKTPARLDAMFSAVNGTADAAALIAKGPQAIANRVYANRLGNGNEGSGDGWRHRGAGGIQVTGKEHQQEFADDHKMPLSAVPAYLLTPEGAMESAAWYWDKHGCNALADGWQISNITRNVNGKAMEAAAERLAFSNRAKALLA